MNVFVAGTGSFAAEIVDWVRATGQDVGGLIEMIEPSGVGRTVHGLPVLVPDSVAAGSQALLGLGGDRRAHWEKLAAFGWSAATVAHPAASLAPGIRLGAGTTIGPRAVVGVDSEIGDHVIVSRGALIGHHVRVCEYATLNPGVNVGGNAVIGAEAFVGMGATVLNGVMVGARAVVGSGALVVRDVEAGTRVQGVPARVVDGSQ
jgi:acetyltransferase EpsM